MAELDQDLIVVDVWGSDEVEVGHPFLENHPDVAKTIGPMLDAALHGQRASHRFYYGGHVWEQHVEPSPDGGLFTYGRSVWSMPETACDTVETMLDAVAAIRAALDQGPGTFPAEIRAGVEASRAARAAAPPPP